MSVRLSVQELSEASWDVIHENLLLVDVLRCEPLLRRLFGKSLCGKQPFKRLASNLLGDELLFPPPTRIDPMIKFDTLALTEQSQMRQQYTMDEVVECMLEYGDEDIQTFIRMLWKTSELCHALAEWGLKDSLPHRSIDRSIAQCGCCGCELI